MNHTDEFRWAISSLLRTSKEPVTQNINDICLSPQNSFFGKFSSTHFTLLMGLFLGVVLYRYQTAIRILIIHQSSCMILWILFFYPIHLYDAFLIRPNTEATLGRSSFHLNT